MVKHDEYESVQSWKLSVCEDCGALLYAYETDDGKTFMTSVYDGFQYHRHGNNKNYVAYHECGGDKGQSKTRKRMYVETLPVSGEVSNKVKNTLVQQAVMRALSDEFANAKRGFKKSVNTQAIDFMAGKSQYETPFSTKQVDAIMLKYIGSAPVNTPSNENDDDREEESTVEEWVCSVCGKDCKGCGRFFHHMKLNHPDFELTD
ncbi:MAG: hypothetical protein PHX29_06850 [Dehalococcoidales bacterium]|nr:hypothetical protein [Dehalococcoidales bacterium]